VCGIELGDDNWSLSYRRGNQRICNSCNHDYVRQWKKTNLEKARSSWPRANRKQGHRPMCENRGCSLFLGVHIAERVLSRSFRDVERMPNNNPGYDFICNKGKKIDVKSSCLNKDGKWMFNITHNTIADYFLCLAFDNRTDLPPVHAGLIPGEKVNHLMGTGISPNTVCRWGEYRQDISKIAACCDTFRG